MSPKLTGYDFWKSVLGSPQYIAAPMVDMSELSFRMLCRSYKAQLCFSPMLHSQQFLQDSLYRSDTFSTCAEDEPLIIQFCSNNPNNFVDAAKLVSSECVAVDLNLGCPQAIAKKGHYGAFLQDDWDLIRSIVRKASTDLPVPVTCKMRILPGDFRNSVQYAKMLEDSGCSVLTVHGRTRDQKGHDTGLASWDVIREIKASVGVPVIANGNILSFSDVEECLKYTGADAVMSAEALLHNPALFTGRNPPVWEIVQEYLQYAEKYNTPLRCVRCHLFKILYLCIHQDNSIQQILAEGKTLADFYSVCDILKCFPEVYQNNTKEKEIVSDSCNDLGESELDTEDLLLKKLLLDSVEESSCYPSVPSVGGEKEVSDSEEFESVSKYLLPSWFCHSRPRVADENERNRGCYRKYFESSQQEACPGVERTENQFMSKKKLRRERHHERVLAAKKDKRKMQKWRRKQKLAELRQQQVYIRDESDEKLKITKKEKKMLIRERLLKAQGFSPKVCINLGFSSTMDTKELTRLSTQLRRLYGSNRKSTSPLHLIFCNFSEYDDLYKICLEKNDGFSSYMVQMTDESPEDMFQPTELVYLSPDSENVLTSLDRTKVYVIGGIVDGTVRKDLSLNHAKELNIETARLPIVEYLVKCSSNPGTTVLTVNQVFDILLRYYETDDWIQALCSNIPPRKGFCAPPQTDEENKCQHIVEEKLSTLS